MKNLLIASAVAVALYMPVGAQAAASASAASANDLAQIREQLQGLMQRVDKLEQENTSLKSENESLKSQAEKVEAQTDYLKAETKGLRKDSATLAADAAKVKGADWAGKVAVKGDLRYRYEMIKDDTRAAPTTAVPNPQLSTADRYRDRIRARIAVDVKATDTITLGFGLTTTEASDPRSGNQTLTGVFSKKALDLDYAFFDWKFTSWGDLVGGKMKQPFFKPAQSAFWDNDITPEGLAFVFSRGVLFGSAYNFWLNEVSGAESTVTADASVAGLQIGAKLPLGKTSLTFAAHYYDLSAVKGRAPFYNANANGNTTVNVGTPATAVLANDFEVIDGSAELTIPVGAYPLAFWVDYARNLEAEERVYAPATTPEKFDTAWAAGILFGKASAAKTWELGASYQKLEKDALFAQFIDSDFGGGVSDVQGLKLVAGYAPKANWTLNATYFINDRNVDVVNAAGKNEVGYDRAQVDFNVKF